MFRTSRLLEQAKREGGEEQCRKLRDHPRFKQIESEDKLFCFWGKPLKTFPWYKDSYDKRIADIPLGVLKLNKYPFSDQHALFSKFTADLLAFLSPNSLIFRPALRKGQFGTAKRWFREGTTVFQRFFMPPITMLPRILLTALCLFVLLLTQLVHLAVLLGLRFPVLWLFTFTVSTSGINGKEALLPGENGYSKVFRGGEDIDLDELETELMTPKSDPKSETTSSRPSQGCNTIAISYKHYANKGKVLGDDNKICRTDLQAIARLIKEAAPCNLRFWIDAKLPRTTDASFERWIVRGVRPYGRYITFICPSALKYAQTSFWLANEYHFAAAAKGVMYLEADKFFFELRYGYNLDLYRRFLQVIIGAEDSPVQVRDCDKGKVIYWAICCLSASREGFMNGGMSPCIDNLTMNWEYRHISVFLRRIKTIVRKFGPHELPVAPGRSWNANNPLLMHDAPRLDINLSNWHGYCLDGSPVTIYFVHETGAVDVILPTTLVLEVTLDKPHFTPGKIHVTRKVLRELDSDVLLNCKFVTLPWLCEWV